MKRCAIPTSHRSVIRPTAERRRLSRPPARRKATPCTPAPYAAKNITTPTQMRSDTIGTRERLPTRHVHHRATLPITARAAAARRATPTQTRSVTTGRRSLSGSSRPALKPVTRVGSARAAMFSKTSNGMQNTLRHIPIQIMRKTNIRSAIPARRALSLFSMPTRSLSVTTIPFTSTTAAVILSANIPTTSCPRARLLSMATLSN